MNSSEIDNFVLMVIICPLKKALLGSGDGVIVTRKFLMETYRNLMETIRPVRINIHYVMEALSDFFFF